MRAFVTHGVGRDMLSAWSRLMGMRSVGRIVPIAAVAAMLALFVVIAALQLRWISRLSEAELQRAKIRLQVSVRAVQTDINRELTRAQILFQWPAGTPRQSWAQRTAEGYSAWRQAAQFPDLIRRVLLVGPAGGGLQMAAYRPETREYASIPWLPELGDLTRQLALPFKGDAVFGVRTFTGIALADVPVLVRPLDLTVPGNLPA